MTHHAAGLRRLIVEAESKGQSKKKPVHLSLEQLPAFVQDDQAVELRPEDRAMLDYVRKLTLEPWTMVQDDVEALRQAGFDDNGILDICQVACYYAFANRLVDGLGVELEAIHTQAAPDSANPTNSTE